MNIQASIIVLLVVAFIAANLPFFFGRILLVKPVVNGDKGLGWRLLELLLLYCIVGAFALLVESRMGAVYPQTWEFYAVTFFLFIVFAYPGFVFRYLWRKRA